jgi:hypothetical protein
MERSESHRDSGRVVAEYNGQFKERRNSADTRRRMICDRPAPEDEEAPADSELPLYDKPIASRRTLGQVSLGLIVAACLVAGFASSYLRSQGEPNQTVRPRTEAESVEDGSPHVLAVVASLNGSAASEVTDEAAELDMSVELREECNRTNAIVTRTEVNVSAGTMQVSCGDPSELIRSIVFRHVAKFDASPIGNKRLLGAASTPEWLRLWERLGLDLPVPDVNFQDEVIAALTVPTSGCTPSLRGFASLAESSDRFVPVIEAMSGCSDGGSAATFVVAIQRSTIPEFAVLHLPADQGSALSADDVLVDPSPVDGAVRSTDTLGRFVRRGVRPSEFRHLYQSILGACMKDSGFEYIEVRLTAATVDRTEPNLAIRNALSADQEAEYSAANQACTMEADRRMMVTKAIPAISLDIKQVLLADATLQKAIAARDACVSANEEKYYGCDPNDLVDTAIRRATADAERAAIEAHRDEIEQWRALWPARDSHS